MSFLQFSYPIITLRSVDAIKEPVDSILSVVCVKETFRMAARVLNTLVMALRDLQSMDMDAAEPQRQIGAKAKPEDATAEQQTFNMKCKIKLQECGKWEMTLKSNLNKACALICSHMIPAMESHVKAESDFDGETKDNPVQPLP